MPRFGWLALLPVVLGLLPGCLGTDQVEPSQWVRQFKSQAIPADSAQLEIAMIECPLGDPYINEKIWQHTDELIDPRVRGVLDDNGFRVGQLVASPPLELQKLLLSPKSNTNSRGRIFPTGTPRPIHFSDVLPKLAYDFVEGDQRTEIVLEQAKFGLDVTARFDEEGRTVLTFVPKVEHGAPVLPFQAASDRSTWELRLERAARKHPEMTFETVLGPNQYLLVGGRLDRERSLGQAVFTKTDGDKETQWLMMIRNCRGTRAGETEAIQIEAGDRTMPLALQAALPIAPGKRSRAK